MNNNPVRTVASQKVFSSRSNSHEKIGIFDSGVGGLSIYQELKKLLPHESFLFFADQAYVPYGGKTKQELEERTTKIMDFLTDKGVKMVVVACNTATVYTLSYLREHYTIPIVGTVPVIKTIAQLTKSKKAAVFSTPATAISPYLDELISQFAQGVEVYKVGGTGLEELVEEGNIYNKQIQDILHESLVPLLEKGVDAIALGCTHYPFLREQIEELVGQGVAVVDSGGAVARRTKQILENNQELAKKHTGDLFFTTGPRDRFKRVAEELLQQPISHIESVTL